MRDHYRTKAAEFYARARNECDVMTQRQYESLASQYSRLAEKTDRDAGRQTAYEPPPAKINSSHRDTTLPISTAWYCVALVAGR
jgi:hypothetical protein